MVSQFIYGRRKTGYGQLGDLGDGRYTGEDLSSFQHLWNYTMGEGCDRGSRPECRSYYVTETSAGVVAQIGRTAFVPAGTSQESGDRDTTLLHKYLFSDDEYQKLLEHPEEIFKERDYYGTVEEALAGRAENQPPVSEGGEESTAELLKYFGMTAADAREFLYAVLDSLGEMESRVYIALPEWNARGTWKALALCRKVISCLPSFWVSACGFLTYSSTFHNSQTNMIPRTVKIIFFPNNAENMRRYDSVGAMNYIIDGKNGYLPEVKIDNYNREMLDVFTDCFLNGRKDATWYPTFETLKKAIRPDALLAPENLSCAYFFMELWKQLCRQGWSDDDDEDDLYYIVEAFLGCDAFATEAGRNIAHAFLKACVAKMPMGGTLLNVLCDYYMLAPSFREWVVDWICEKLSESKEDRDFKAILNYSYEDPQLAQAVKERMYQDASFYPAALHREVLDCFAPLSGLESWEERTESLYSRFDELAERCPAFLGHEDTMSAIGDYVVPLCYDGEKKISISMKDLGGLFERDRRFREKHEGMEGMSGFIKQILQDDVLKESLLGQMEDEEIEQLAGWVEEAEEELRIWGYKKPIGYIQDRMKLIKGAALLLGEDGDACVRFLGGIDGREVRRLLVKPELDVREMAERLRFETGRDYLWFYGQLYLAREADQVEILILLMEKEDEGEKQIRGGIIGLNKFWRAVKYQLPRRSDEDLFKKKINRAVNLYYENREITSADIKDMKTVRDFVSQIGLESYLNEGSVFGKLKNLKGGKTSQKSDYSGKNEPSYETGRLPGSESVRAAEGFHEPENSGEEVTRLTQNYGGHDSIERGRAGESNAPVRRAAKEPVEKPKKKGFFGFGR